MGQLEPGLRQRRPRPRGVLAGLECPPGLRLVAASLLQSSAQARELDRGHLAPVRSAIPLEAIEQRSRLVGRLALDQRLAPQRTDARGHQLGNAGGHALAQRLELVEDADPLPAGRQRGGPRDRRVVDAQRQRSQLGGARGGGDVLIGQRRVAPPRVQESGHGVRERELPHLIGVVGERYGVRARLDPLRDHRGLAFFRCRLLLIALGEELGALDADAGQRSGRASWACTS